MSKPRPVFAGDIIHIQRRTIGGHFFLVPKRATLEVARYAFAAAAARYGLIIHALCVMSNHIHVVATDPRGRHPAFTAYAHRLIALALKRMYDIEECVWAAGGPSVQRLNGRQAIIDALAYVRINPVAAGCVRDENHYPGVFGADERAPLEASSERIDRPAIFGQSTKLPKHADFKIEAVKLLIDELGERRAAEAIASAICHHRDKALSERKAQRQGFLGMKRVLAADIWQRAPNLKAGELRPTFKGVTAEAIRQASATLRAFRHAYAEALARFRGGSRDVTFPPGTYKMQHVYGVLVSPAEAPAVTIAAA